jgi:hypothetical protein
MKLIDILNELLLLPSDLERLNRYGEDIIEEYEEGPYTLVLTRNRHNGYHQVGLTSNEQEFTTQSSQQKRATDKSMGLIIQVWGRVAKKLQEWNGTYGRLAVGSFNKERTEKYRRILHNFGFEVGPLTDQSGGNYFFINYTKK